MWNHPKDVLFGKEGDMFLGHYQLAESFGEVLWWIKPRNGFFGRSQRRKLHSFVGDKQLVFSIDIRSALERLLLKMFGPFPWVRGQKMVAWQSFVLERTNLATQMILVPPVQSRSECISLKTWNCDELQPSNLLRINMKININISWGFLIWLLYMWTWLIFLPFP